MFRQTNTTNTANNLQSNQAGLGRAGLFNSTNTAAIANAVDINVAGTGFALRAASSNVTPKALLTAGGVQLTGIGEAANKLLKSDATGNATWSTAAGAGLVSGTGTLNFLPKWTPDGTTLGNSQIFDIGGNIGIGTTNPNGQMQFSNLLSNRKLVLYDEFNSDHQYFGFGINPSTLRYQVGSTATDHVFYAGTSATTSNELMRIKGNGNVGIGITAPVFKLHVLGDNFLQTAIEGTSNIGTWLELGNRSTGGKLFGIVSTGTNNGEGAGKLLFNRLISYGSSIGNIMTFDHATGGVGIGTDNPTAQLHVAGSFKLTNGSQGTGKVLVSDADGSATWQENTSQAVGISIRGLFASLSIPHNVIVPITQWSLIDNEDGGANYNSSTGEYTVTKSGVYQINAAIMWNTFSANASLVNILATTNDDFYVESFQPSTRSFTHSKLNFAKRYSVGDKIKILLYQNSGVTQTTLALVISNNLSIQFLHN